MASLGWVSLRPRVMAATLLLSVATGATLAIGLPAYSMVVASGGNSISPLVIFVILFIIAFQGAFMMDAVFRQMRHKPQHAKKPGPAEDKNK